VDAYQKAIKIVHAEYNQARVTLSLGGYAWGTEPNRNLDEYKDAIVVSDFLGVQAMQPCDSEKNGQHIIVPQIRSSVKQLGTYGKPVMITHFQLWGEPSCRLAAFDKVRKELFTDASLKELVRDRLFAWCFMDEIYLQDKGGRYAAFRKQIGPHVASLAPSSRPTTRLP
jgi:hypothetical protein